MSLYGIKIGYGRNMLIVKDFKILPTPNKSDDMIFLFAQWTSPKLMYL